MEKSELALSYETDKSALACTQNGQISTGLYTKRTNQPWLVHKTDKSALPCSYKTDKLALAWHKTDKLALACSYKTDKLALACSYKTDKLALACT
jgi:hypothetical protein